MPLKDNILEEATILSIDEQAALNSLTTFDTSFYMKWSNTRGAIAAALAKAQGEMTNGKKDVQGYGYKYMDLGSLIDVVRLPLSSNEIAVTQSHEFFRRVIAGSVKKPAVVTHTALIHSSGEYVETSIEIPIKEMSNLTEAQMVGVAATYGRRYVLQALCLVASEEDTDGTTKK